jgi:hypothetical protein
MTGVVPATEMNINDAVLDAEFWIAYTRVVIKKLLD